MQKNYKMISEKYKGFLTKNSHWLNRNSQVKEFLKVLENNFLSIKNLKVLDAGCAQGRDTQEILNKGIDVIGLDINENFLKEARKRNNTIIFEKGDIENLHYKKENFNAIYCINTLFYTNPKKSLPEIERVLKKGGIAFLTLDKNIIDLDKIEEIHHLDIEEALSHFRHLKIISKKYFEREDSNPFKHIHFYYEIVLIKE
jgi:ubiquinone/menaquinone biosynthesis C-methylase UbiE